MGLTADPNHAHEVGVDLSAIEFAVAISIGLTHEPERRRASLTIGHGLRQSDHAVAVDVAFMKCSGLRRIIVNPFAFREPAIGVCIGSGEDNINQVLGRLLTRKLSVVVGVGESESVVRDCNRSGRGKCLVRSRAACQSPKDRGQHCTRHHQSRSERSASFEFLYHHKEEVDNKLVRALKNCCARPTLTQDEAVLTCQLCAFESLV